MNELADPNAPPSASGPEQPSVKEELSVMLTVADALEKLRPDARQRVLDYVIKFFRSDFTPVHKDLTVRYAIHGNPTSMSGGAESGQTAGNVPDNLAELFSRADPSTDYEKALIVAYDLTHNQGEEEFDSYRINSALTHLGHRIGNITRALDSLVAQRPAPVVQTRKEGKSKQARKKFKLTVEGRRRVEQMLAGGGA